MGTQSQTPGSQSQTPGEREKQAKNQSTGQDAGSVPTSDDDVGDEDAEEGTREDAAGSKSRQSKS